MVVHDYIWGEEKEKEREREERDEEEVSLLIHTLHLDGLRELYS